MVIEIVIVVDLIVAVIVIDPLALLEVNQYDPEKESNDSM
jgi:hypothetical protein